MSQLAGAKGTATKINADLLRLVKRGRRITTSGISAGVIKGVLRIDAVPVKLGRTYRIAVSGITCNSTVANDRALVEIRHTTDGSQAVGGSALLPGAQVYQWITSTTGGEHGGQIDVEYEPTADVNLSLLVTVIRNIGTGNVAMYADGNTFLEVKVYDSFMAVGDSGVVIP